MKKIGLIILLAALAGGGCSTRYNITLYNGDVITARGKPKFDREKNGFFFTDASHQPAFITALKVKEVAPASMSKDSTYLPMH